MMIQSALGKGKKTIFLVHYRQLAYQAMKRFADFGMSDQVSIIMAGEEPHYGRPVQVISIQTYGKRLDLGERPLSDWFQEADLVFYDEAHASIAKTRKAILDLYKDSAVIVGLTATPCRADGRPLGAIYQDIITVSSIRELTEMGYLVPAIYYSGSVLPDLKGIPMVAGDYNKKVLGGRIDKPKLVGDILENWLRIAPERSTVIFATNVKHSLHLKERFNKWGVSCEHVDAHTPSEQRQEILERFEAGETQVVTNVGVYSEGADFPWVSCIVLARPTFSFMRYWQMTGRGGRPYPGKKDYIVIDHAGNVERHGFMDDPVIWSLDGKDKAWKKPIIGKKEDKPPLTCSECLFKFRGRVCPNCGLEVKGYGKRIRCVEARLFRLDKEKKRAADLMISIEAKKRFLRMAEHYGREKQYKPGYSAVMYKKKYKVWPPNDRDYNTEKPDKSFKNFLTYLWIRGNMGRKEK
jgi:superfamily II DNA or RNA helicase